MKKIIKKILTQVILPVFLLGFLFIPNSNVKAAVADDSFYVTWLDNIYFTKFKDGVQRSERARLLRRSSDGQFVYCIQPGVNLIEGHLMPGYDSNQDAWTGMTQDEWTRIKRLVYYGYGYKDRTDPKWYAVTQYLIWKTHTLGWDTYFTDSFKGNIIYPFQDEINQLNADVEAHLTRPSFNGQSFEMNVGETLELVDTNNVLSNYELVNDGGVDVKIEGNKLIVNTDKKNDVKIKLSKKLENFATAPIVYVDNISQNVMTKGFLDPVYSEFKINIHGGKVEVTKVDKDTGVNEPQGAESSLKGATYGIYNMKDEKVGTIVTDENGKVTSSELPSLGRYYLLEESASEGYLVSNEKYYFEITSDNIFPEITVYEKVINRDFEFTKVYADDNTGIMTPEPNVEFGFYDINGELVAKEKTDSDGRIKVNLVYGTYTVKQLTTTPNHEKVEDFIIKVENIGKTVYKVIANAEIKAKLKLVKIDSESGKTLNLSGIKFKIFDINKNEYVCQNITYPTTEKVCVFQTDKNGEFVTPYKLSSGKYRIEEIDQEINGYLWNSEPFEFEVGDDSELINDEDYGVMVLVKFANKQVKGQVIINKLAEKLVIENDSYHYEKVNLEGAEFNIYAADNIITKDGITHYKKDELVATIKSDENGLAKLDDMYLGKYYIKEVKTPDDNLVLDKNVYNFELTYKDQYTELVSESVDILNKYKKGTLDFTKVDISTGEPLPNTTIKIYDDDKNVLIFEGKTDSNGKIVIDNLYIGNFRLEESEAPENYKINPNPQYFSIKENGEIVKATMADELIIEVPDTDSDFNILEIIIPTVLISLGVAMVLYAKSKKNKEKSQSN